MPALIGLVAITRVLATFWRAPPTFPAAPRRAPARRRTVVRGLNTRPRPDRQRVRDRDRCCSVPGNANPGVWRVRSSARRTRRHPICHGPMHLAHDADYWIFPAVRSSTGSGPRRRSAPLLWWGCNSGPERKPAYEAIVAPGASHHCSRVLAIVSSPSTALCVCHGCSRESALLLQRGEVVATVRSASGRSTQEPPLPLPWHCDRGARAPSAGQSDSRDERPGAIAPRRRLRSSLGRNDYRRDHVSGEPGGVLGAACSDRDESIVSKRLAAPVRGKAHLANIHPRAPAAGHSTSVVAPPWWWRASLSRRATGGASRRSRRRPGVDSRRAFRL